MHYTKQGVSLISSIEMIYIILLMLMSLHGYFYLQTTQLHLKP